MNGATASADDPTDMFWGDDSPTVWFEWTCPVSDTYIWELDRIVEGTQLAVDFYTGSPGAWSAIIGTAARMGSNPGVFHDEGDLTLTGGTTYYLAVNNYQFGTPGSDYTLSWHQYVPPSGTPTHDDIDDAYVFIPTNSWQSHDFVYNNATNETNEGTERWDFPALWAALDPTDIDIYPIGSDVGFELEIQMETISGDVAPYLETTYIVDSSFDPASPDFSKLNFGWESVGNGTQDTSVQTLPIYIDPLASGDNTVYIFITDYWEFLENLNGTIRFSWRLKTSEWNSFKAVDYINPDSTFLTVTGTGVADSQEQETDWFTIDEIVPTLVIPGSDFLSAPGIYEMHILGVHDNTGIPRSVKAIAWRNDYPIIGGRTISSPDSDEFSFVYKESSDVYLNHAPYFPIKVSDRIQVHAASSSASNPYELQTVAFKKIYSDDIPAWNETSLDEEPLGYARFDAGLYEFLQSGDDRASDFEFVILSNGNIYASFIEADFVGTGTPSLYEHYGPNLIKWDGSSWTQIETNLAINANGSHKPRFGVSMTTDANDNIYIGWWELDEPFSSGTGYYNGIFLWHVIKYIPGVGGTELGSGQANDASRVSPYNTTDNKGRIQMKISPNGDLYVGWTEFEEGTFIARPYLWKWNGSSWTDTSLPNVANMASSGAHAIFGFNVDTVDFTFCHHDGLSDTPSCIYFTFRTGGGNGVFVYQEYDGSSWDNQLIFTPQSVFGSQLRNSIVIPTGMTLIDDGQVPYFWSGFDGNIIEIISGMKLKIDGTAFEALSSPYPQSLTETWGYNHGDAAIGPDGNLWACYFSAFDAAGTFEGLDGLVITRNQPNSGTGNWLAIGPRTRIKTYAQNALKPKMIVIENDIYIMTETQQYNGVLSAIQLGVWKGTYSPSAPLGAINLSRIRFRAYQEGDA